MTGDGSGGTQYGDLHVKAALTWAKNFALTLDAYHTIDVEQAVVDAGNGAVTLTNNHGGSGGVILFGLIWAFGTMWFQGHPARKAARC